MNIGSLKRANRAKIIEIMEKYGARTVRFFGSVATGSASQSSDLDVLVEMNPVRK